MKKVTLTKRQMRKLFREIIYSAYRMSNLPYEDKHYKEGDKRRHRTFIAEDSLEYIMRNQTDRAFGEESKNKKNYNSVFGNGK